MKYSERKDALREVTCYTYGCRFNADHINNWKQLLIEDGETVDKCTLEDVTIEPDGQCSNMHLID